MFGFSLTKILVWGLLVAGGWYLFKMLAGPSAKSEQKPAPKPPAQPRAASDAEETVHCSVCGNYVPAKSARACERADCPFPR